MSGSNVIPFRFQSGAHQTELSARQTGNLEIAAQTAVVINAAPSREQVSSAESIYPDLEGSSTTALAVALGLLQEADQLLGEAVSAAENDNLIAADDAAQRVEALLPELFCCRSLGDGFGTVILSIYHGLNNLGGQPVSKSQIAVMAEAIRRLRREPLLDYDAALVLASKLERSGMSVDPPSLSIVGELLLD
jgi:hypothetical protein